VRHYQIVEEQAVNAREAKEMKQESGGLTAAATSLVEIGPRFVLDPIRIFRGSFGGQTLYQNPAFISPNEVRAVQRAQGNKIANRKEAKDLRKARRDQIVVPEDPLETIFK
jgi:ribosome biogenesis protein BRX1